MVNGIDILLQARMGSTRLPNKTMMKIAGKPLLAHVIERLKKSKLADRVIIITTKLPEDNVIVDFAKNNKTPYFRGSENDVLDRYYQAAKNLATEIIVRSTADDPLKDPKIIDKVSNLCRALTPKPNNGINPKVKNMTRTIRVHFNFSLKERCFWDGPSTSGRLFKIVFHTDILLFFACAYSKDYLSATALYLFNGFFGGIRNLYPVLI
ncbi:MAG: hypothetical protein AABX65_03975 [Nanoarchaeota archaeon]